MSMQMFWRSYVDNKIPGLQSRTMFWVHSGHGSSHYGRSQLLPTRWEHFFFVNDERVCLFNRQITLSGLLIVVANFATMLYYDPHYLTEKDGATGPPQWIYFTQVNILLLFVESWLTKWTLVDGPSDCLRTRASMLLTESKRDEQAWQVLWVKCSITVCLSAIGFELMCWPYD